jgi:flagellin FlaB
MHIPAHGGGGGQRGITGLETAIILIAFVVVASVFAFTVLSTGIFSSEQSKKTIFAGLNEVRSSLQPRGSVIAYKGAFDGTTDMIYKVSFVVSNAVKGEAIDLTPPYTVGNDGDDPDIMSGAATRTVISYSDDNQFLSDLPWSIAWPGYDNGDNLLESGESAEITVWLADRVTGVTSATDSGGIALMDGRRAMVAAADLLRRLRCLASTTLGLSRSSLMVAQRSILSDLYLAD